jgi:hypothetical protein
MFTGRRSVLGLAAMGLVTVAACSGPSSESSPNVTPGQCVLRDGIWYCGGAYGNYADCPAPTNAASMLSGACSAYQDTGVCLSCYESAGYVCSCPSDGGQAFWVCLPSETECDPGQAPTLSPPYG